MTEPKTTTAIIEDTLARPIAIPPSLSDLSQKIISEDINAFIAHKRKDLDPLLSFTRRIESIIPGFLMNILVQNSKKDEDHSRLSDDRLIQIKIKQDEHFANQLQNKKLLIGMLFEILEIHHKNYLDDEKYELIRELYEQVHLWNINAEESLQFIYFRIANSSKIVPTFITAAVAQATLTPYICAMVARMLNVDEAGKLAKSFKAKFLAEASFHLEAETVARITDYVPLRILNLVTDHLVKEEHFVHMGEITDFLSVEVATGIVESIEDIESISHIISFMQNIEKIKVLSNIFTQDMRVQLYAHLKELGSDKADYFML